MKQIQATSVGAWNTLIANPATAEIVAGLEYHESLGWNPRPLFFISK